MQTILIISGGLEAVSGIRLAKKAGLFVVVSDGDPDAPGFQVADGRLLASTYDVQRTVEAALDYNRNQRHIDGVLSVAADVPQTVAAVARALSLPGISEGSAFLAADKLAMKRQFKKDGVAIPWFSPVESLEHLRLLVAEQAYPLVLKPVDSRGARGVLRLTGDVPLDWAYSTSRSESPSGRVMLEEFLPGPQVSTESVVLSGKVHTVGFADRNYELLETYAPFIIENGGQMPSRLPRAARERTQRLLEQAASSLGISEGVIKGDVVVTGGHPAVIELAARLSGGYFCTHQIPLSTGVDLVGAAFDLALGNPVNPGRLTPRFSRSVAQRFFFPRSGVVSRVSIPDRFEGDQRIEMLEIYRKPGDHIGPVVSHPSRAGVVITAGSSLGEVVGLAQDVAENVRFEMA
jgi:biotin carboxylase